MNDLLKTKNLFNSKNFDGTAFYCHEAVEKALKAVILLKTKEKKIQIHSLIYLGKEACVPQSFFPGLRKLSPQYMLSRYPDVSEEAPYELYDEGSGKEFLGIAEQVIQWTEKHLK